MKFYIKSVSLINVKSYSNETTVEFQKGTNAISGENGAGKSTIIEAIGYALFDSRPYTNMKSMIRHGKKSGEVRVSVRGVDGRDYLIVRSIGGNSKFYVLDEALHSKISSERKEEVLNSMRQIMGIGVEKELSNLFKDVIGVPQGLIVAPFLETPQNRKAKFDPILGIEEYEKANASSRDIINAIKEKKNELENRIKDISSRVEDYLEKKEELEKIKSSIVSLKKEISEGEKKLRDTEEKKKALERVKDEITRLEKERDNYLSDLNRTRDREEDTRKKLQKAKEAEKVLRENSRAYHRYLKLDEEIKVLNRKMDEKEEIDKQLSEYRIEKSKFQEKMNNLVRELKDIEKAEREMPEVERRLEILKKLEKERDEIRRNLDRKKDLKRKRERFLHEIEEISAKIEKMRESLMEKEELERQVCEEDSILKKMDEKRYREKELQLEVKRYQESRKELQSGICPYFRRPCPLVEEDTSELFVEDEKRALSELDTLRVQIQELEKKIEKIGKAKKKLQIISLNEVRIKEWKNAISEREKELQDLEKEIKLLPEDRRLDEVLEEINKYEDSRARFGGLRKEIEKRPEVEREIKAVEEKLRAIEKDLAEKKEIVGRYSKIAQEKKSKEEERLKLKKAYELYLKYEKEAEQLDDLKNELRYFEERIIELKKKLEDVERELRKKKQEFSPEMLKRLEESSGQLREYMGKLKAQLENEIQREREIAKEVSEKKTLLEEKKDLERKLEVENTSLQLMEYIRRIYKEVPRYLRKKLLSHITKEANRQFHQLMGDNTMDIVWESGEESEKDAYEIFMKKGREVTEFKLLSGGQKMAAALAIRLALIRYISGLGVAFFDEPTHNLDEERRNNLARAFSKITGFEQLFVISHDETFNSLIENSIRIVVENGVSKVIR